MKVRRGLGIVAVGLLTSGSLYGQQPALSAMDTITVVPGAQYEAGALHRFLLGSGYRRLWTHPLRVEQLDLAAFAGGLTPIGVGGGQQTRSLRFRGSDGREYAFRSIDKDLSAILPPELRETLVDRVIQDQIGAAYPVGALAVAPILAAVGVLHVEPILVVLPDDPRLKEFREEFAGIVGLLEERPDDSDNELARFAGATSVVGTTEMLERVEEDFELVDAHAFLAARLVDVFLGDWDRHADQWRWARFGTGHVDSWQPIPRDRDQAFVRMDGLMLSIARQYYPQLVRFDSDYPNLIGLTWNGRDLDRRLLSALEWPVWDSIASALVQTISDSVIDRAVAALPHDIAEADRNELRRRLSARRDGLRAVSRQFYEQLASEVDIHTTDRPEVALVQYLSGEVVEVSVATRDPNGEQLSVFHRRFRADETKEVRLLVHGGMDSVLVQGPGHSRIDVRIVGGGEDDVLIDEAGGARLYDTDRGNVFVRGPGTSVDTRTFEPPPVTPGVLNRDWGSQVRKLLWVSASPDIGLLGGIGLERYDFGFRTVPWASRLRLRGGWATTAKTYRLEASLRAYRENSPVYGEVNGLASGLEILRFYGFGNETTGSGPEDDYRVEQNVFAIRGGLALQHLGLELRVGPALLFARTERQPTWIAEGDVPYGMGRFGQVGLEGNVMLDRRDRERNATRGAMLRLNGSVFPALWDVEHPFGSVSGDAAVYLSPWRPLQPTLAVRIGAKKVFGRYPFQEAAYLGDAETVRLNRRERYAGDALAHGNTELRFKLFRATLVLPADFGVFGLWDLGRVWYEGESSDQWHSAFGGGPWIAFLKPENVVSFGIVRSPDGLGLFVGGGFAY